MTILITIFVILLQLVVGYLLGFIGAMALGVGNGWELLVIGIGNTLGVWGVGTLATKLRKTSKSMIGSLVGTAVFSALGTALILLTPATGFAQLLYYPLVGAIIGYYLSGLVKR